jgi:hypothetical protein
MATIRVNDDAIWLKNIEGDPNLQHRIRAMRPGDVVDLEVDGVVGRWQRMKDGRDGRPTFGIKPIAEMRQAWARMSRQRGKVVPVREVITADSYLTALAPLLSEWDSLEDEEAFRDL